MRLVSFILLLICTTASAQTDSLALRTLTSTAMKGDFAFLRRVLTETHPGLYRYNSPDQMKARMDSVESLLGQPMGFYEFHSILSGFIADIRCAHTYITPVKDIEGYFLNKIKTIPLIPFNIGDKFYAVVNGSTDKIIKPGIEIIAINGQSMIAIREKIYRHVWADGYNKTLKAKTISEAYFPLFYYLTIGRGESFTVTVRDESGKEQSVAMRAQAFNETKSLFMKNMVNSDILAKSKPRNELDQKKPWRLTIKDEKTAVIRIKSFGGGRNEEQARQKMTDFMDKTMKTLQSKKIVNLIIDLRYNSGGWDIQPLELYTYLIDKPARAYRKTTSITDSTEFFRLSDLSPSDLAQVKKELKKEPDGTFSVQEEFSEQLKLQQPKPNHFTGKVYVLVNGGSASASAEFAAYARSNGVITVIGEETGGAYEGGNGGSFLHFTLPNSKMALGTPLLRYENNVSNFERPGRGTMPDHIVPYKIEDILSGVDTQMEFVLKLLSTTNY